MWTSAVRKKGLDIMSSETYKIFEAAAGLVHTSDSFYGVTVCLAFILVIVASVVAALYTDACMGRFIRRCIISPLTRNMCAYIAML